MTRPVSAVEIPFASKPADGGAQAATREFRKLDDGVYLFSLLELGVELRTEYLRRERFELFGELHVRCDLPGARVVGKNNALPGGTLNFSNPRARHERGKLLADMSNARELDWPRLLEEFAQQVLDSEREGAPGVLLRDVPLPGADAEHDIEGWRLPASDMAIGFGDAESGKSALTLYAAGLLAARGVPSLIVDFEWTAAPHRGRLGDFFPNSEPPVHYLKADRPLVHEAERIRRYQRQHGIAYTIFDSIGYACAGRPEDAEHALAYARAARPLGGGLHLAHITKTSKGDGPAEREFGTQKPFGSNFWHASARSTWFFKRTNADTPGPLRIGLYQRKRNDGPRYQPIGLQLSFRPGRIDVSRFDLSDEAELAGQLPIQQRMKVALRTGAMSTKALAEELDVPESSIRQALKRDIDRAGKQGGTSAFIRVDGGLIGISERRASNA